MIGLVCGLHGDLDGKVSYFVNELDQLYCSSFPVMTKRISSKRMGKPWLTPELIKMIKLKSLYFKLSKVGVITGEFNRQYRNGLNSAIGSQNDSTA